ncbi:hypothetical protein ACH4SP_37040 [Streptomyces sp. NPDC021093]|uniref:hypothetical protein n=1 Tax=Streptomyces sp. NPDC021093 TaxID=3365112 RepID=UPI00378EF7D9
MLTREVFTVICSLADPKTPVAMGRYFKDQGWNERDVREILRPINPSLITRQTPFFHVYMPTERGLNIYGGLIMSDPAEHVNIWAGRGSFVGGINIGSSGATAQAGHSNTAATRYATYQRIAEALRGDAEAAEGLEATSALDNADDLEEAIASQDQPRIDRILGRINSLLSGASSAFALTREATNLLG